MFFPLSMFLLSVCQERDSFPFGSWPLRTDWIGAERETRRRACAVLWLLMILICSMKGRAGFGFPASESVGAAAEGMAASIMVPDRNGPEPKLIVQQEEDAHDYL
jgi:hypothetical protein